MNLFIKLIKLFFLLLHLNSFAQNNNSSIKNTIIHDSSFIYELPFKKGTKHYLIQGYKSCWSHKKQNALDFVMKKGTIITAARKGIVSYIKQNGFKHGILPQYADHGNFIAITHSDGTIAEYWHIQRNGALVHIGDTVEAGQIIGLSGNTGYSALPHLHFEVWSFDPQGIYKTYPTLFKTVNGNIILKPNKKYFNKE